MRLFGLIWNDELMNIFKPTKIKKQLATTIKRLINVKLIEKKEININSFNGCRNVRSDIIYARIIFSVVT